MFYPFTIKTTNDINTAFDNSEVVYENKITSATKTWHYLFIKFHEEINLAFTQEQDIVDIIFAGDAYITKCFKEACSSEVTIEAGLRWIGSADENRKVQATGFAIKISQQDTDIAATVNTLINVISSQFNSNNSLLCKFKQTLSNTPTSFSYRKNNSCFFQRQKNLRAEKNIPQTIKQSINSVLPSYTRANESGLNVAYQDIKDIYGRLAENQKVIWLLRSDGILAFGVKNAYWISFGDTELASAIDENLHPYIDWDNRYGHPTLAIKDEEYDGAALYGGYICQRQDHLQVFTSSGRYYRSDLNLEQKKLLENYIASQLREAFGEQDIIFHEGPYKDFYELSLFFADRPLPHSVISRKYAAKTIASEWTIDKPALLQPRLRSFAVQKC